VRLAKKLENYGRNFLTNPNGKNRQLRTKNVMMLNTKHGLKLVVKLR